MKHLPPLFRRICAGGILWLVPLTASAQSAPSSGVEHFDSNLAEELDQAVVRLDDHPLFVVGGFSSLSAEDRAKAISGRIMDAANDRSVPPESVRTVEGQLGTEIFAADRRLMIVTDGDARLEHRTRAEIALINSEGIRGAIRTYRLERAPRRLIIEALWALGATLLLVGAIATSLWLFRWLTRALESRLQPRIHGLKIQSVELIRADQMTRAIRATMRLILRVGIVALCFVYAIVVLGLFPWPRQLSTNLFGYVVDPLRSLGLGFIAILPKLLFLLVVFAVTRLVIKALSAVADGIERGLVTVPGFDAEWAKPTYRIIRVVVII